MLVGLKEYFEESPARNISLVSFMKRFPDIHEKDRIISTWTGALSYLRQHSSQEKRQLYGTLRGYTPLELGKIVDKELQETKTERIMKTEKVTKTETTMKTKTTMNTETTQAQGQDPSLPALPSGLSPIYNEMFRTALQLLQEPGDVTKKKPAFSAFASFT
ncbi:hypothetical protein EC957_005937 [Mortierella hygrophila]|uniref:Uncharacterized protein n=1 Tax=Mortierella hygrophila TaxID=979708 RepID=A0A9P6FDA5_9FUNG|nr:hypothetical protein EC957_005937 [Mortierella hygrophila]